MQRVILVVDDIRSNREILKKILGDTYRILEATHGEEAIAVLSRYYEEISVVLLDLAMPVMDGFAVLEYMRVSPTLYTVPVIVTTGRTEADSEMRALELGAIDFIPKPYHAATIRQRIRNTIRLRETAATVNALRLDHLTGLPSRMTFFDRAEKMLTAAAPGTYVMASFDIDRFRVINDQYGIEKGDEVLCHIARTFDEGFSEAGGLCARIGADDFAVLYPAKFAESKLLSDIRTRASAIEGLVAPITFSIGRYLANDLSLTPSAMYDRATLAAVAVKGRYDVSIAWYDEAIRTKMNEEQEIVSEMVHALNDRQFAAYVQPQYNHATGALVGAEALVRWMHPVKGRISPGVFIPIFERNGFVYSLDQFVWREACRYQRKWLDEGLSVVPISVNISRYDILCPDLIPIITGLLEEYHLPPELLRLEVTESAFADAEDQIVKVVKQFVELGFTVEIDDFGSAYSSLNTLKNVPAQVLKLDMKFLQDEGASGRGGNILESMVRMAKWLNMSVIAEGVEDAKQADFLKSIGCYYIQGYLYAKPMPMDEYEQRLRGEVREEKLLELKTVEHLDNSLFWDPHSMDTLIFNSYVGAACVFELRSGHLELLRINDKYRAAFGTTLPTEQCFLFDVMQYLDEENKRILMDNLQTAIDTHGEAACEVVSKGLYGVEKLLHMRTTVRTIARSGDDYLFYCMVENTTAQREAEQERQRLAEQLSVIMSDMESGVTATVRQNGNIKMLFSNDKYYTMLGHTRESYEAQVSDERQLIHPEDRDWVMELSNRSYQSGEPAQLEYRSLRADGKERWLRVSLSNTHFSHIDADVQLAVMLDITAEKRAAQELLDNLPCGAALYEYDGVEMRILHLNRRYWELVNRPRQANSQLSVMGSIHPEDRARVFEAVQMAVAEQKDMDCNMRVRYGMDAYRSFHVVGRMIRQSDGKHIIYASFTVVTDEEMAIHTLLPAALQSMMQNRSDISFLKDKERRYICCSKALCELFGVKAEAAVVGKTDADLLPTVYAARFMASDAQILRDGVPLIDVIDELPDAEGVKRYINYSKFPMKDVHGNVVGVYCVGQDVTKTRTMQSQLELLTNCIPGGLATYEYANKKLHLLYCNDGLCKLFHMTRADYLAATAGDALHGIIDEDRPILREQLAALFHHDTPVDCVYRVHLRDGSFCWINLKALSHDDGAGKVRFHAVFFDVTEQQEALVHLRKQTDPS